MVWICTLGWLWQKTKQDPRVDWKHCMPWRYLHHIEDHGCWPHSFQGWCKFHARLKEARNWWFYWDSGRESQKWMFNSSGGSVRLNHHAVFEITSHRVTQCWKIIHRKFGHHISAKYVNPKRGDWSAQFLCKLSKFTVTECWCRQPVPGKDARYL